MLEITVDGFSFSAAHLIPGHPKCGRIHGHNYQVQVSLHTKDKLIYDTDGDGMVVDFHEIKEVIKCTLDQLDHKLLLPQYNQNVQISKVKIPKIIQPIYNKEPCLEDCKIMDEYVDNYSIQVEDSKFYIIPQEDCMILPIEFTTVEYLAKMLFQDLNQKINALNVIISRIDIWETEHSKASYFT